VEKADKRVLAARVLAVTADAVQFGLLPLFAGGAFTGFDAALDVAVGAAMVALVGWHWAFLPAFALELVPAVDLAPTWTIAVFLATRGRGGAEPPVQATRIDPPPLPPGAPRP
jgi:hypothetical protein